MKPDTTRWWTLLAVAGATYALLDLAEGFIALPLREWSSMIAATVLRAGGVAVERSGTILSTGRLSFDVVPACSGSTTLQVLLLLGIVWTGSHPHLSGWRRAVTMATAAPLAILANGLRVAALVLLGDMQLQPVEGPLHTLVGICTFCMALGALVLLSERLATTRATSATGSTRLFTLLAMIGALAVPVVVWTVSAWISSPLDRFGWLMAIAGLGFGVWAWRRLPEDGDQRHALPLFGSALAIALSGVLVEINALHAMGLVLTAAAVVAMLRGTKAALALIPVWILSALATPVSGFALTRITSFTGPGASLTLRLGVAALCVIAGWWWLRRRPVQRTTIKPLPMVALALTGLVLAVQIGALTRGRETDRLVVSLSYLQGNWTGDDLPIGAQTELLLGRDHLYTRRYNDDRGRSVDLIVTSTGGDRHRSHPPEYCMTGAGWLLDGSDSTTINLPETESVAVARRRFVRDGQHLTLLYWFNDGAEIRSSYSSMLGEDTWRRLRGRRTDWIMIRLIGSDEEALRDFAAHFTPHVATP